MSITRRGFLIGGVAAGLLPLLPRLAFAASSNGSSNRDVLVVIFQRGGMDALQAVPPWGDADYYRLRPNIAIPAPGTGSSAALPLDGRFGLHPSLAALSPLFDAGRLAIVHSTGLKHDSRSHFECQDHIERAHLHLHGEHSGWLNRHLATIGHSGDFQAIGFGTAQQTSLRGPAPALGMSSIAKFAVNTRSGRKTQIEDSLYQLFGAPTLMGTSARQALDAADSLALANPGQFAPENGASYPTTTFGSQLSQVAQLIKANVGLEVACVDIGGWDHHDSISTQLPPLLDQLARGLAAFDSDLGERMANVTVVTMTEFGRRAYENASGGTDHGSGSAMFLLGGGVRGGQVYADWPGLKNSQLFNGDLDITIDYRTVLAEMLEKRAGNSAVEEVFSDLGSGNRIGCFDARSPSADAKFPKRPLA